MKKIIYITIFIGILFLGDRVFALIISNLIDQSSHSIAKLYSKNAGEKIIIIGNSHGYRHLNAPLINKKLGVKVSNFSQPGGSTLYSSIILQDYINLYGKPDIVILEASNLLNDQRAILKLRPFQSKSQMIDDILKEYFKAYYYGGLISHVFRYNNNYSINIIKKVFSNEKTIFESNEFEIKKESHPKLDSFKLKTNIDALKKIISICKTFGIELKLIITPSNSNYDLYLIELKKYFPNQEISDFSSIDSLNSRDYYDSSHLNKNGVLKLIKEMKKVNFFDFNEY